MQNRIGRAILKTLIYSDIFDYPLSKNELLRFLIGKKIDRESFENFLKNPPERVSFRDSFYYLSGKEQIIKTRIKRKKESQRKIVIAKKIIKQLHYIPTIQLIGISGALSLENSEGDGDIDLFVITLRGKLWITRLAMIILLMLIGRYRRRNQRRFCDKICLNMLIDESALSFPKNRQDLYTAHEIAQLMPVFERGDMYKKFIMANEWVKEYLPNVLNRRTKLEYKLKNTESFFSVTLRYVLRGLALEHFAKTIQLWSIRKHITQETISDNFLALHPLDYREKVLREYKRRLRKHGL